MCVSMNMFIVQIVTRHWVLTLGEVCERYVYSGTLFSLRKRRIVNFIQACPSCLRMKWGNSLLSGSFVCTRCPYFVATYTRSRIPWVGNGGGYMQVWGYMYL